MTFTFQFSYAQSINKRSPLQFSFQGANYQNFGSTASAHPSLFLDTQEGTLKNKSNFLHALKGHGIDFGVSESLKGYNNFMGGLRKGSAVASTFDASVSVDNLEHGKITRHQKPIAGDFVSAARGLS